MKLACFLFSICALLETSGVSVAFADVRAEWGAVESEQSRMEKERSAWEKKFTEMEVRCKSLRSQWGLVSKQWWAFQLENRSQQLEKQRESLEEFRENKVRSVEKAIDIADTRLTARRIEIAEGFRAGTPQYDHAMELLALEYEDSVFSVHDKDLVPAYERYAEAMTVYLDAVERAVDVAIMAHEDSVKLALVDLLESYVLAVERIGGLVVGRS